MALYFFDVDDNGRIYRDDTGLECSGHSEVKREAIKALAEITKEFLPNGDHHRMTIKVRDESGQFVLQISMRFDVEMERISE